MIPRKPTLGNLKHHPTVARMTNDEIRMTNEWRNGKSELERLSADAAHPLLVIRHCLFARHSGFVIRH